MKLFLVAGEASADIHAAAALLRELLFGSLFLHCYGVGGEALAGEGMELVSMLVFPARIGRDHRFVVRQSRVNY